MNGGIFIKRVLLIFAALLLVIAAAVPAFAAEVGGGQVHAQTDAPVTVPVIVTGNDGLMGCKLTVRYDPAVLSPQAVSRGSLTKDGLLEDSIAVAQPGSFDIVWSSTTQAAGDGTLCTLLFKALKASPTEITLDYSPRDTFNEAFEDVALTLQPIAVAFDGAQVLADETLTQASDAETKAQTPADNSAEAEALVTAVESVMDGKPLSDPSEKPEDTLLAEVNTVLEGLDSSKRYEDVATLQADYTAAVQETYVDDVLQAVDGEEIRAVLQEALTAAGAETLDAVPQEKRAAFVAQTEQAFKGKAPDLPLLGDRVEPDDAFAALQTLQAANEAQIAAGLPVPALQEKPAVKGTNHIVWYAVGAVALLLIAGGGIAGFLHHKKKSKIEEEPTE